MRNIMPGEIVCAVDPYYGSYIGEFVSYKTTSRTLVEVRILSCFSYPRQHAIFNNCKKYERTPYSYGSIQEFYPENIGKHIGNVSEYSISLRKAILVARRRCRPVELEILQKHYELMVGKKVHNYALAKNF